jgi:hypothetical protein
MLSLLSPSWLHWYWLLLMILILMLIFSYYLFAIISPLFSLYYTPHYDFIDWH